MRVIETWKELRADGSVETRRRADFTDIPEQLQYLRNMVNVYRGTTWARQTAMQIIAEARCPDRNKACYAKAIGEAVQARVKYVNELPETFQTPPTTWRLGFGDCDDQTTTVATLLEAVGIPSQVVGMKVGKRPATTAEQLSLLLGLGVRPGVGKDLMKWRHVYPRAVIDSGGRSYLMNLDTTLRGIPVGTFTNPVTKALERGLQVELLVFGQ